MSLQASLLLDVAQLTLDLAGILDPTGIADASSGAISLLRGRFLEAGISAVSLLPYVGDLSKVGKIPRYLQSIRKACQLGLQDLQFGRRLKSLLPDVQRLVQKLRSTRLPESVQRQLFEIENEITRFLSRYDRAVLSQVKIPHVNPASLIASTPFRDVTQQQLRNELARSGLREAHNAHFLKQLLERGPKRGIQNMGDFARQFNAGARQVGKEEGTVEVILLASEAKAVLNLKGELVTFVIGDLAKLAK